MEAYEVFVQWKRGKPHEHAETITASDPEMALTLAKRNVDLRSEPVSIWVSPQSAMARTASDEPSLVPSTDRAYRNVRWYAETRGEN